MKYLKKINWQILALLFIVVLYSCEDNSDPELLFEDVPAVRFEKKLKKVSDFLIAPEAGWKMTYFTDETALGGFTFLFDFINESEVRMDSDFGNADPTKTSLYGLSLGATLKLTFTTKNVIHELSDGANFPDAAFVGQGYKGDFEFLFSSIEGEDIIFRSNRNPSNYIKFVRASKDEWNNLSTQNRAMLKNIKNDPSKSVFRSLTIENKGNVASYSFNYNNARRFSTSIKLDENGEVLDVNFGIAPTATGFKVSPAITVGNIEVENFIYDEINNEFVAEEQGAKVTISYVGTPAIPLTGKDILPNFLILHNPFLNSLASDWTPDLTNVGFSNLITNLNASIFFDVTRIDLYDLDKDSGRIFIGTSIGNAFYNISKEVKNGKIYLTIVSTTTPQFFTDAIKPLLDVIVDSNGLYVDQPTTLNGSSNRIFSFVPASNTTIRYSAVQL